MFGFKKTKVELDKDTLINTCSGDMTIEELVNALEEAKATIAEQESKISNLEAEIAAAKPAEVAAPEEGAETEAAAEAQPMVEVKPVEEPEGSDAELKAELSNSASEEEAHVVSVPNVRI